MEYQDIEQLFKSLFHKYYPQLMVYVRGLVGPANAEDIVEDTFEEIWTNRNSLDFSDKIVSYLYRSALSHSLNYLRHKNISQRHLQLVKQINMQGIAVDELSDKLDRLENEELFKKLMDAIDQLPEKCSQVFKLKYLYGMKVKEISDVLNISPRTVEAHNYKALKLLRERFSGVKLFILMIFWFISKCFFILSALLINDNKNICWIIQHC